MSVQPPHNLQEYLQRSDVQERITKSILQARSNVTVTISKAAELFDFTESRLREWEKKGLLTTDRNTLEGKEGHRRYTTNELSKLAVLEELFNNGGYTPSDIPKDYAEIWERIATPTRQNHTPMVSGIIADVTHAPDLATQDTMYIDHRIEHAEQEVFWRYFTSQVLRLSLMFICEDIPDSMAGLILPLKENTRFVSDPRDLSTNGQALIGWLSPNGSFNTFLSATPHFEHPSDFRLEPLLSLEEDEVPSDKTMIVVQRKARPLGLSLALVQTVRSLLHQVYANISQWYAAYDYGLRDYLYQATDFSSSLNPTDDVLNKLMDMVIQLGGSSRENAADNRWKFCCLLLPQDSSLPVQRRALLVRAQSADAPYKSGTSVVSTEIPPGLCLRTYQSGNIIYEPDILVREATIAYYDQERSTRSAIALPVIREDGLSIAALYVASEERQSFPIEDQRILRLIGTMIEELLLTYQARQQASGKRTDLFDQPEIVDPAFKGFLTENDFISDLEKLLETVQAKTESEYTAEEEVSFIAIDIDNQSTLATRYGNHVAKNLSREVGIRLQGLLNLFTNPGHQRLYHVNADRYYLLLDDMLLEEARKKSEQLRAALAGDYLIDTQQASGERLALPENMLKLHNITVRIGVPTYKFKKLVDILGRFSDETAVYEVRTVIIKAIDEVLKQGRRDGGNVIISWDAEAWGYRKWTPTN